MRQSWKTANESTPRATPTIPDRSAGSLHRRDRAATAAVLASLRGAIAEHDTVLAIVTAGLSSRGDAATPARAAALRAFAGPLADAAEALVSRVGPEVASLAACPGAGAEELGEIVRAAAALGVRAARLRLRLVDYGSRGRSNERYRGR